MNLAINSEPKRFYLGHPFDLRVMVRLWEQEIESAYNVQLVNPFYDQGRTDVFDIDAGRVERYQVEPGLIVEPDIALIASCDGVVAIMAGCAKTNVSFGTPMELVYAYLMGVPIFAAVSAEHVMHPWLQYHCNLVVPDMGRLTEQTPRIIEQAGRDEALGAERTERLITRLGTEVKKL